MVVAGLVLARKYCSSERGRHAKRVEKVARYPAARYSLWHRSTADRVVIKIGCDHAVERGGLRAPVEEVGRRDGKAIPLASVSSPLAADNHQTIGIANGRLSQQHSVNKTENGCVGTDAEGEGKNGNSAEARGLSQHAQGVADVL